MMEQLCGESGDSQKKMHADVSISSKYRQPVPGGGELCARCSWAQRGGGRGLWNNFVSWAWVACVPASAAG